MPDLFLVPLLLTAAAAWAVGVRLWQVSVFAVGVLAGRQHTVAVVTIAMLVVAAGLFVPSIQQVSVFAAGLWWGALHVDGSERDGRRFWRCSRRLALGRWLRRCYGYRRQGGPPDLGSRTDGPVVYAVSPHGVVTAATVLTFLVDDDQSVPPDGRDYPAIVTHPYNLATTTRDLALWLGCVAPGTATARTLLAQRRSLVVVPGGRHELDRAGDPAKTHDWLLCRVYAQWKAPLVPVWAPDEFGVAWTWRPPWPRGLLRPLQRLLKWPILEVLFAWPRPTVGAFRVRMGDPLRPQDYATYQAFKAAYLDALGRLRE